MKSKENVRVADHHSRHFAREDLIAMLRLIELQRSDGILSQETYGQLKSALEKDLDSENRCPSCNSALERDAKYCIFCGFNMEAARG